MSRLSSLTFAAILALTLHEAAQSQDTTAILASQVCTDCIQLNPVAVFGGDYTGDDLLSGTISLSRATGGRTYISDIGSGRAEILVYGSDGELEYTIRRRGQGPGEFADPAWFLPLSDGRFIVFDPGNARTTMLSRTGGYLSSSPLRGKAYSGFQLDDSTLLIRGDVVTLPEGDFAFHIVDVAGTIRRSFGRNDGATLPAGEDSRSVEIARMPNDHFASFMRNQYVIEIWDPSSSDQPKQVLTRAAPWFEAWTSFPPPNEPPASALAGAYVDAQRNFLLTLIAVPDEQWQPPSAARAPRSRSAMDGRFDSIVEVTDLSTYQVVASQRFDRYLFGFAEDGSVYHLGTDSRGVPLWELFAIDVTER